MKSKIVFFAALIILMGCANSGTRQLVGTWEIIEFRLIGTGGDPVSNEKILRDAGAVWDIKFSQNGHFRQDFNMRSQDMRMEIEEGTWKAFDDSLKIEFVSDIVVTELNYTYELDENILVLSLRNPVSDARVVTRFRKK
jgi:hypothetical protein